MFALVYGKPTNSCNNGALASQLGLLCPAARPAARRHPAAALICSLLPPCRDAQLPVVVCIALLPCSPTTRHPFPPCASPPVPSAEWMRGKLLQGKQACCWALAHCPCPICMCTLRAAARHFFCRRCSTARSPDPAAAVGLDARWRPQSHPLPPPRHPSPPMDGCGSPTVSGDVSRYGRRRRTASLKQQSLNEGDSSPEPTPRRPASKQAAKVAAQAGAAKRARLAAPPLAATAPAQEPLYSPLHSLAGASAAANGALLPVGAVKLEAQQDIQPPSESMAAFTQATAAAAAANDLAAQQMAAVHPADALLLQKLNAMRAMVQANNQRAMLPPPPQPLQPPQFRPTLLAAGEQPSWGLLPLGSMGSSLLSLLNPPPLAANLAGMPDSFAPAVAQPQAQQSSLPWPLMDAIRERLGQRQQGVAAAAMGAGQLASMAASLPAHIQTQLQAVQAAHSAAQAATTTLAPPRFWGQLAPPHQPAPAAAAAAAPPGPSPLNPFSTAAAAHAAANEQQQLLLQHLTELQQPAATQPAAAVPASGPVPLRWMPSMHGTLSSELHNLYNLYEEGNVSLGP